MKKKQKQKDASSRTDIRQAHQPVSEPTVRIKARVVTEEQLENFLKDTWDDTIRSTWWDRIEKLFVFVISLCIPELYHWAVDTFSKGEKIQKEAFTGISFLLPAITVVVVILAMIIIRSLKSQYNRGKGKIAFIEKSLNKLPMNMQAEVSQTDFRAYNPSTLE